MGDPAGAKGKASPGGFGAVLDRLREKKRQVLSGTYDPIMPARRDPAGAPLSFAQQRLWFLAQLRPDDPSYNVAAAVDVRGRLAVPALAEAFRRVAERHETLRTTFEVAAGQPTQVAQAHGPEPPLPAIDLEALAQGAEAEGERLARAAAARPFDLERGPLLRTFLVRLDPDRHLLSVTLHHLVGDAWSMGVLIREISALYRAALGRPASLPPLPVQYADFAVWQREKLQGDAPLAWWMERLKGAPPELELPADRPRPAVSSGSSGRGARHRLALPPDTVTGLQAVARSEETTLFVVLLAGFQALLRRWTGQEDVVVGTPFANRRRLEIQGLIGFFVNTLPIRTDLTGRPSFRELLRQVREHVLSAHAHQDLPFERIVEELRPERAAGRNPFFQVVFAFQNVPLPALELPGLELTARHIDSATAMFDLTLDLAEQADGIQGWLEFATDLFAPTTAARFAAQWRNLLAAASEAPDSPFLDLPCLAPGEHHQLVTEWNDRAAEVPAVSIQRLFEEQADLWPEAVAVEDGRRSLTYAELDARANRLARQLRRRGVAPEVPVAFCLERSIEAVETILAILKAGGAYVPLSPSYPAERLSWLMADSGVRVLVTAPGTPAPLVPREIATVDLARDAKAIARRSAGRLPDETDPGALAYVLYTSGSTGHPKGVAVTHRNVVRLVRGTDFAAFGPEEVWLLLAPLSFDASTLELWGPLLNGGRLSIFPSRVPSLEDLARLLETRGVTALWLTAGLFHQMVDLRPEALRSLRRLLAGGDVLSPSHVRRALQAGIALVNGYGPTEGTTFTCCHAMLAPEEAGDGARVSIGRPIANARVYVAGPGVEPAPIGVAGELLAGGEGLARGYLGRPDLTAEMFVPDPFSQRSGSRLYRTGDRVRLLADGRIDFLGRLDRQVKIRGFRIEPGEVEAALTRHPAVAEAVVSVVDRALGASASLARSGDRRLIAYLVPVAGEPGPTAADLRRFLEAALPAPLIPSDFVTLPELPRTANQKVDRAALPVPMDSRRGMGREAPRGVMEELLARLWEQVLGVSGIGAEDGFFELGGHSLLAVRLLSRIREVFEVELPLADLFQAPTLRSLALRIKALRRGEEQTALLPPIPAILPEERHTLPLSLAQERLLLFERMNPGTTAFHMPLGVRFRGALDVPALARSVAEVLGRHEVLRTCYPLLDGRPHQRIEAPASGSPLPIVDLSGLSERAHVESLRIAGGAARRPFELAAAPPFRGLLVRTAADEHELFVTLHHIAADGWSLEILVRELSVLYRAFGHGEPSPLPGLSLQFADWSVWQRRWLEGAALDDLRSAWRRLLEGAPTVLELPVDRPRSAVPSRRGGACEAAIDGELAHALESLSREEGCTLYMTLLAAFEILIRSFSGQDDFLIGSPAAGRSRGETEGMIGFFVNLLPLRANLRDGLPFRELQRQVREATLAAWSHQEMPFDELVRDLRPVRDPARSPLFQVVFAWQETPDWNLELPGVATEILPPPTVPARYDLSLTVVRREDRLDLHLAYDADLFEGSTAETLLRRWSSLLHMIRERPDDTIDRLEAGDLEDLFSLRGPAAPDPARCVHHLFDEQAAKTPEAEAVAFGDLRLSYSALALRARTLAHRLRRLGVGPEVRVGLCCQPGPAAVIGILGILSAGGAWVPVDPSGPAERQLFFLADSGARALVTEPAFASRLAAFSGPRLVVDPREDPATDPGPFESGAQPENLAYVLYTSGSTGTPKGVGVEHRQLVAYLAFVGRVLFAGRVRSCPFLTSPTFDACLKQVLAPLLRGETVWRIEAGAGLDVRALLAELERREQVAVNCTPTLWRAILEEVERRGSVPGLSRILLGGERLNPELFARTVAALPQAEVWNLYGPTETTANATAGRLRPGGPVVLGEPIDGAWICLLDRRMLPVPRGMPGEICVGGTGVARGYLGELSRPELTAERFVPDSSGTRLYRTGDLGRLTPDGELIFLGRTDRQVKLRGIRIELGEIEARLERHPLVREAAVAAKADRLTAYVVPMSSGIDTADLRSALMRDLPDSMVPAEIVALDRLPRLASGKVDHAALLGSGTAISTNRAFAAPRTATERQLADIWEEMLERKSVGIHDNFFELGGHSLQSIRISHRAAAAGLAISPRDLLQHPTIAELAALVQTSLPPALPGDLAIVPEPGRRHEPFPLSEIQQAYLVGRSELFELGGVGPTSYLEAEWTGLDVPRLENAWRRLVERHDMLRAVALPEGSWQILAEVTPYEIGLVDLRGLEPEAAHTALTLLREEMSSRLFLPGRWPLFDLKVTVREGSRVRLHVARDLLVGDVRSSEILLEELMHLYREPAAELPPLELSIRDYALAVDALHDREAGRQARAYWQARLADLPPAPDLPLSPRPGRPSFLRRTGEMAPAAWNRLAARSTEAAITPSVLLCAAFAEVLASWSRGERFSINVLYARRLPLHPQVDRLVGNFASTVLLEVDGLGTDFEQRVARLQERLWEDLLHGLVSGVEVLRKVLRSPGPLEPRTLRAAMPVVFSSALPFARAGAAAPVDGLPELVFSSVQTPQVALEVLVTEISGALRYTWNSVEDAFPPGFIADMFEAYGTLLRDLCESDETWHRQERVLPPEAQLLRRRQVNDTAELELNWPPKGLLHEPIAEQALRRPEEIAVAAPDRRMTYRELSSAADQIASELRRLGARPGRLVGVVMEKGWEQAVAVLAILRAGAAYLPVDPSLPLERRQFLLEHGDVEIALTQPSLVEGLEWPKGMSLPPGWGMVGSGGRLGGGFCDTGTAPLLTSPHSQPPPPRGEEPDLPTRSHLAYVLFTSGSTGVPKGVMIEHRAAANTVADVNRRFGISAADRVLALSALSFDLSVWDLFGILGAGGRVVLPEPEASRDPDHWHQRILGEGVTVWNSVPALMELYVEYLEDHGQPMPESLRLVLLSGDWIPLGLPDRIRSLSRREEPVSLVSLGGATEASIWSIFYPIEAVSPEWKSIPYGRPMANQTFQVLNERLDPCPDWVPGQLHIGGVGLARGYWKDPEKTCASFFVHPRSGERLYRTGDLGRWLPDGQIELLGREDLQVKIQGYRVELGEIEATLSRHPAVREAVVAAVGESKGHKRLVAYCVPAGDPSVEPAELRVWLEERLPEYMVPHLYVPLAELPLTPTGKVDRKALPAPEPAKASREQGFRAPRTPTERRMASLWEAILETEPVGLTDELFELGGDSMLALRLLAEIEKDLGCRLPLAAFFQEATVERLAALVDASRR